MLLDNHPHKSSRERLMKRHDPRPGSVFLQEHHRVEQANGGLIASRKIAKKHINFFALKLDHLSLPLSAVFEAGPAGCDPRKLEFLISLSFCL